MQNKLDLAFRKPEPCLICYMPIGDPLMPPALASIYADCGVDVVEVGIPTHNPYLDGPVISQSMHRVLSTGMTVAEIVDLVGKTRVDEPDPAAIWFCYSDVELQSFRQWCEDKLLDGLLLVDADHRSDADDIASCLEDMEIPRIAFVTAEIDQDEIERAIAATGYIMLQAFPGKTGARNGTLDPAVAFRIERLRDAAVGVPIVLGNR